MERSVLKIRVTDIVKVCEGTVLGAVGFAVASPYFQPQLAFRMSNELDWATTEARAPSIIITDDLFEAA